MTVSEALEWIANLFEESVENIKPETTRDEIDAWDSLGVLTLIAALDEKFNILMTEKEIDGLKKVNDILDLLRRNGKLE
jgi:acyl carrier protein